MKLDVPDLTVFSCDELDGILDRAAALKAGASPVKLAGKTFGSVYFNPSLRTRASFDVACSKIDVTPVTTVPGGDAWSVETSFGVVMDGNKAEHVKELAGVMGRYVDALGVRAFGGMSDFDEDGRQEVLKAFLENAQCPVVNLESPLAHPCQALADMLTLKECGLGDPGAPFLLTWAYHPKALPQAVARSALRAAAYMGLEITLAFPEGFDLEPAFQRKTADLAKEHGGSLRIVHDADEAYHGQRIVYAKSWSPLASYGSPAPASLRDWIVSADRMCHSNEAIFMHCLPVRRNVVVSDEVLDGPASVVLRQAENRIWVQAALLEKIMTGGSP